MQEAFLGADDTGKDLEHVEVVQKKFDEMMKDLANEEEKIKDINENGQKLIDEGHPDKDLIEQKLAVRCTLYLLLVQLTIFL